MHSTGKTNLMEVLRGLYWEGIGYSALVAAAAAAVLAVIRGSRGSYTSRQAWSPVYGAPAVLALLALAASMLEPVHVEASYPLLFAAVLSSVLLLRPRIAPIEVLAASLGLYAAMLASLRLPPVWPEADPRLLPWLWLVIASAFASAAFAAAGAAMVEPPSLLGVLGGVLAGVGFGVLGFLLLARTHVASMLYGDPLSLGLAGALVASVFAASRPLPAAYAASMFPLSAAIYRLRSAGYVEAYRFDIVGYWLLVYLLLVTVPRVVAELRAGNGARGELVRGMHWLLAALLLGVAAAASTEPYGALVPVYAAVAAALGAGAGLGALAAAVAAPAGFLAASVVSRVYAAVAAVSLFSAALVWARAMRPPRVAATLLLVGLAVAAYTGAGWVHRSVEAVVEPLGLGGMGEAGKPDATVIHGYFMVYLGAKNESVLYALLEPKLGHEEALRMARFAHAVRVLAEKRGIKDPYNITQLSLPEKMPSLVVRVEPPGVVVEVPPASLLVGLNYTSREALVAGLGLARVSMGRSIMIGLARGYLGLVSDPSRVDGNALRYSIYTAMCISWAERGNMSETAPLLLSALNGSLSVEQVRGEVFVAELPFGLAAAAAASLLLASAPVAASAEKKNILDFSA